MKVYKTGGYKELIETVEAEKVTDKSVWLSNGRNARHSNYANYFDTIDDAKEFVKLKLDRIISISELKISKAKEELKQLSDY